MPVVVAAYLAVILVSAAVMIWGIATTDPGDPSFAAIYLVMFAFPSSLVAMVPTMVSDSDAAGVAGLVLLVAGGLFQVWLLWTAIVDRRRDPQRFLR